MSQSVYSHLNDESGGSSSEMIFDSSNQQRQDNNDGTFSVRSSLRSIGLSASRNCVSPDLKEPLKSPSAMTNEEDDPYFVFRDDLYRKLDLVEEALQEYKNLSKQDTTAPKMLKAKKKQLKRSIRNADSTLNDVKMTISLVESQPGRFSNQIDSSELYERRALVMTSQDRLERVIEEVDKTPSPVKQQKPTAKKTAAMNHSAAVTRSDAPHDADIENNYDGEQGQNGSSSLNQLALIEQQDETLDELGLAVERVGGMATNIHEEIGYQNKVLEEMDDDLADAEEQLGMVMGKLGKLLKTKNKWQLRTILALILIVLILIFLILM